MKHATWNIVGQEFSGRLVGEDWESEIEPISVLGYDYSENCLHPWSAPHLEICSREATHQRTPSEIQVVIKYHLESQSGVEFIC